ncbi:MAG: CapA family protein [Clostridia bacterium]|nr:CapA family protein [Clostridia bacterium]
MKIVLGADLVPFKESEKLFVNGDIEKLFGDVLPILKGADRLIVNLECALTTFDGAITKCGPNLKADPACADTLVKLGVTDVMLSNNHTFDFGTVGLRDTMKHLDRVGLPYTGVGENDTDSRKIYYFEQGGKKFGIVNVCEHEYSYALPNRLGTNPYDPYLTMHDIREAKKNADIVIVIYHGGKEYCRYPSPRLRLLCHEMVECGADVVLTQHIHCIGCYEE